MNIAIEYVLRQNRVEQLLTLPCSLFLENTKSKLIVTIMPSYGANNIVVRRYLVDITTNANLVPPYEESIITWSEIFNHTHVIIPEYKLLEFHAQPFASEEKQVNDLPMAAIQERQYKECLMTFFNPRVMNRIRENWLWRCFDYIYIEQKARDYLQRHNPKPEYQREFLCRNNKTIKKVWGLWKKNLLFVSDPASELIFAKYYDSQFLYMPPKLTEEDDEHEDMVQALAEAVGKHMKKSLSWSLEDENDEAKLKRMLRIAGIDHI